LQQHARGSALDVGIGGNQLKRQAFEKAGGQGPETCNTGQQRSASDQVVAAMTQVSDVSRQYAVGSKQAAAAAAQLNVLAAELRASIAQFKVG